VLRHTFPEFIKGRKPDNGAMLYGKLVQTTVKEQGLPAVTSYKWEDVTDVDAMLGNPGVPVGLPGKETAKVRLYHTTRTLAPPYSLHTVLLKVTVRRRSPTRSAHAAPGRT
jgi:hypothetical protein